MTQYDGESARSASMHESTLAAVDHVRVLRADGAPDETCSAVLREAERLTPMTLLAIQLDFDPDDLVDTLRSRGYVARAVKVARRTWSLVVQPAGSPTIMDLSELEAPMPMETILEAAAALGAGESLFARTPCFPRPLLAQLDRRRLDWQAVEAPDGCGLIWVGRPS